MKRRTFFGVTLGAITAAVCGRPRVIEYRANIGPNTTPDGVLRWQGVPITVNRDCPTNMVYFLNHDGQWVLHGNAATFEKIGYSV